jgi:hypothetical protein
MENFLRRFIKTRRRSEIGWMVDFLGIRMVIEVAMTSIGLTLIPAFSSLERSVKAVLLTATFLSCRSLSLKTPRWIFVRVSMVIAHVGTGIKLFDQISTMCHLTKIFTSAVNDRCVLATLAGKRVRIAMLEGRIPWPMQTPTTGMLISGGPGYISTVAAEFLHHVEREKRGNGDVEPGSGSALAKVHGEYIWPWYLNFWDSSTIMSPVQHWTTVIERSLARSVVSLGENSVYAAAQLFSNYNTCTLSIVNFRIDVAKKAAEALVEETNDMKENWWFFCFLIITLMVFALCMDWIFTVNGSRAFMPGRNTRTHGALEDEIRGR